MSTQDTKSHILDCALLMFADKGYANTSMRALANSAKVNLASTNYHFGSKDKLLEAVIDRYILPLNNSRKESLDKILSAPAAKQGRPQATDVLAAFLQPTIEFRNSGCSAQAFIKLVSRSLTEPDDHVRNAFLKRAMVNFEQLFAAMCLALPDLPPQVLKLRLQLSMGTLSFALGTPLSLLDSSAQGDPNQLLLDQVHNFVLAGLEAPL